jgi:hypothetical protein
MRPSNTYATVGLTWRQSRTTCFLFVWKCSDDIGGPLFLIPGPYRRFVGLVRRLPLLLRETKSLGPRTNI